MEAGTEKPSPILVVVAVAVVAVLGFLLLRGGENRPDNELTRALDKTLEQGGSFTATVFISHETAGSSTHEADGVVEPNSTLEGASDNRTILGLINSSTDVREVGTETIAGEATTRYSADVDAELYEDQMKDQAEKLGQPEAFEESFVEIHDSPPAMEVWVAADGTIRRFKSDESYQGGVVSASTTIDFAG